MEAWRGHFMKLRKGNLDFIGDSKMWEMPKPWDVCGAELRGGGGPDQEREGSCGQQSWEEWRSEESLTSDREL